MEIDAYLYLMGQLVPVIARALPGDVADATALVAGLGSRVGAVLHDVTHLERQQSKLSKYNYPGVDKAFLTKKI